MVIKQCNRFSSERPRRPHDQVATISNSRHPIERRIANAKMSAKWCACLTGPHPLIFYPVLPQDSSRQDRRVWVLFLQGAGGLAIEPEAALPRLVLRYSAI